MFLFVLNDSKLQIMVLINLMKMNCVAVIVRFVCGERMKAINILKPIN